VSGPAFAAAGPVREASLLRAMASAAPENVRIGCRVICEGDEAHLLPGEASSLRSRPAALLRASGAARWLAHGLMAGLGVHGHAVIRKPSGEPTWPEGLTGSLAHDDEMAVAAVARAHAFRSIGIDIEPALPLPGDVFALVATDADSMAGADRQLAGRVLFSVKEAVYKAVYPLDHEMLEFEDIAVDLSAGRAVTRTGRSADVSYCVDAHVVAFARVR
jgi:4'-phosphopantetheinyl transferase EntD